MYKVRFSALALAGAFVMSAASAATLSEDFATDPMQKGWRAFGNTNLFQWDSSRHALSVTWDSRQPNSFFYYPLENYLTRHDDFSIDFDLLLDDAVSGIEPGKTGPLQIGIGFQQYAVATGTNYMRGAGLVSDIAEFGYYPHGFYDFGIYGLYDSPPSSVPSFASSAASFSPNTLNPYYVLEMPTGQVVHVAFSFTATNQTAALRLTTNGVALGELPDLVLDSKTNSNFAATNDYRVDMFSITSYSSVGDDYDSLLAHGQVSNVRVVLPPPAQDLRVEFTNGVSQVTFSNRTNWLYVLERTTDMASWSAASAPSPGNGGSLTLQDGNVPAGQAFYRVRAQRP